MIKKTYTKHWASPSRILTTRKISLDWNGLKPSWTSVVIWIVVMISMGLNKAYGQTYGRFLSE